MPAYSKALASVIAAGLSFFAAATAAGPLTASIWINGAVALVTATGVYLVPNTPDQPWLKAVVAVLGASLTVAASAATDGVVTSTEWLQIALAALGAVGVGTVANVPSEDM